MNDRLNDALNALSFLLGYLNLTENREQSRHNDVQAANDKQAAYLLHELKLMFENQNIMIQRILEVVTGENHKGSNGSDKRGTDRS